MMLSNGKFFRLTSPLCGEFTNHRWIPLTKGLQCGLWCSFDGVPQKLLNKQSKDQWFETTRLSCDIIVMFHWITVLLKCIIELEMSFYWNFCHWFHRMLSFWQLSVQPVTKILPQWWHFCFSDHKSFSTSLLKIMLLLVSFSSMLFTSY